MAAFRVEPQQMVAQQRQFFLPVQRPDGAPGKRRTGNVKLVHQKLLLESPRGASNP
jgi:hypothetical protein